MSEAYKENPKLLKHSHHHELVEKSLGFISINSKFRQQCLEIVKNKWFDRFILLLIMLNSLVLALTDYGCVDPVTGEPSSVCSWRNELAENTELIFTVMFTMESMLKIISLGMVCGDLTYLKDPWNCLDFTVVCAGIIGVLPNMPNVSALRTFRVLRPLRSLSALPGLRLLVTSLLSSVAALVNVLVLLVVVFAIFGILGVQLWSGRSHNRCRLTPYPVRLEAPGIYPPSDTHFAAVVASPNSYKCIEDAAYDTSWSVSTSPWATPRNCFWPVVEDHTRLCSYTSSGHSCPAPYTCGSNYDEYGNPRFVDVTAEGTPLLLMDAPSYVPDFNFGITTFDHMGRAFVTIFQCITMEGWAPIMFMIQDSYSKVFASVCFCFLILFASFFLLNLTLAVIWEEFDKSSKKFDKALHEKEDADRKRKKALSARGVKTIEAMDDGTSPGLGGTIMFDFVTHTGFTATVIFLIILNTIILALDHHPMDESFEKNVEYCNFVLTIAFTIEMAAKILGLGFRLYTRDPFNMFDAVIVTVSMMELVLLPPVFLGGEAAGGSAGALSALRTFRLFRVFKLARNWHALQVLLATIVHTLKDVANFGVLLLLFMYIYSLIGMQFFANNLRFDSNDRPLTFSDAGYEDVLPPRAHFDDLLWAFTTVFQTLTGENWNAVLYDCWRGTGPAASVYFITLVCFGDWITMNLFLAILLGNFENMDELGPSSSVGIPTASLKRKMSDIKDKARRGSLKIVPITKSSRRESTDSVEKQDTEVLSDSSPSTITSSQVEDVAKTVAAPERKKSKEAPKIIIVEKEARKVSIAEGMTYNSLFVFKCQNPYRNYLYQVMKHPMFENGILVLILVSSILLAIDSPLLDPDSGLVKILNVLDIILTVLFTMEMMVKVIALGFVAHNGSYLRNSWNILDFLIVGISIISLAASGNSSLKSLRSLRTLRALRPLRMISRRPGLKLVVNALFRSIPSILNVLFVCVLFLMIFSVVGINYFKGTFMGCQGDAFDSLDNDRAVFLTSPPLNWENNATLVGWMSSCELPSAPLTSKLVCECWGLDWEPTVPQNFDNIRNAMGALFELSTTEGWVDVMYAGVDAVGIDMQPIRDYSSGWVFFFISYMVVGSFFAMNLFVGVVIDNFNRMKEELGDNMLLTDDQKLWVKTHQMAMKIRPTKKPPVPSNALRAKCYEIESHKSFEFFIFACIVSNSILMAMEYFGQSDSYGNFLSGLNLAFSFVFTVEAIIKLMAFGKLYYKDGWNCFDFAIVCGSNTGLVLTAIGLSIGSVTTIIQLFRVGRIVRLVNGVKSLRQLFNTLLCTLPSLGNIGSLLFLLFFMYAVMSVQLYALVGFNGAYDHHTNFQDFWTAMITLMSFSTGENWNGFMYDLSRGYNNGVGCENDVQFNSNMCGFTDSSDCVPLNGCGSWTIFPFLYSFTLMVTFVMLNLFIAVILEGFSEMNEDDIVLTPEQLQSFRTEWEKIDPEATCFAPASRLVQIIERLLTNFGVIKNAKSLQDLETLLSDMDIPIYEGRVVHFKDVMEALAKAATVEAVMKKGKSTREISKDKLNLKLAASKSWGDSINKAAIPNASIETFQAVQKVQKSFKHYKDKSASTSQKSKVLPVENSSEPENSNSAAAAPSTESSAPPPPANQEDSEAVATNTTEPADTREEEQVNSANVVDSENDRNNDIDQFQSDIHPTRPKKLAPIRLRGPSISVPSSSIPRLSVAQSPSDKELFVKNLLSNENENAAISDSRINNGGCVATSLTERSISSSSTEEALPPTNILANNSAENDKEVN